MPSLLRVSAISTQSNRQINAQRGADRAVVNWTTFKGASMDPRPVKQTSQAGWNPSSYGLDRQGIVAKQAYWNLSAGELYEHIIGAARDR
jgi:hypothetical protein